MLMMPVRPGVRVREGPFLLPARVLLLGFGLAALALSIFILFHELHAKQVDAVYAAVALAVGVVWLASIILAFRGQPLGVFLTRAIPFVDLGVIAQAHFAATAGAIGSFVRIEGLPVATALIRLVIASLPTLIAPIAPSPHS